MKEPVRILIVEDNADDADLAKHEIRKVLTACEFQLVEARETFLAALDTFQPDVILADYTLPRFEGMNALALTLQHAPQTPFIMWTGSINEDAAVNCMKAGANNYILKDSLRRLGPAILHALEEKELIVARRQAEERYQSIFENSMEGIFQSSPEGRYLNLNPAMARLYGYDSPQEMVASIHDIAAQIYVEPDKRSEFMRLLQANDGVENFEARNYCKDGSIIWTSTSARVVRDTDGNVLYYEGSIQDITQRKRAEEALQNNEKRFRALIENGLDGISLLAADGSLLWESPSTFRNLGYQPNEFVGRNIFELMHPDDLEWTRNTYTTFLQKPGDRQCGTFRLRRADGTWGWVEAIATNMLQESSVNAIVVNYRDITEQKQTEIELQQKNADLALINALNELINRGEALDAVMNRLREETKRIFSNEYTNIYLLNEDGQSLKTDQYSLPPHVREKIERLVGRVIPVIDVSFQPDSLFQSVLRSGHGMVTNDQKVIQNWMGEFVETSALPPIARTAIRKLIPQIHKILNIKSIILVPLISDGKPLGVLNVSSSNILMEQDLKRIENIGGQLTTALYRRQVEEMLKEERNLLRTLIDNVPDRIYAMDMQGRKTLSNTADWQASGGKTMEEVIGRTDFELYPPEMADEFWRLDKAVLDSGQPVINYEEPGLDANGNQVSVLTTKIPLRDEEGNVVGLVGIGRDITERKQAESERQALLEIMQGLANTRDLHELLQLVHRSIAKVIYAENFFIVLHQENSGLFEEIYSVDQYDPPQPPSKLENSITSYVFRSGKPLLLTQASFEKLAAQGEVALIGTDSASWLGVPLKTSGRTIGVMAVQDYENDNRYSDHEKDFLISIATQVALVIERKRAEEALRESEEHYRTIFEGVQDAIFVESLDGKILMVNERACEMFGYSQAEFLTKTVADLVPPGNSILTAGGTEENLSTEPRETMNKRANGEVFPIEISGRIQVIHGQKVLLVVVRDVTERKRSEDLLRESEERFSSAFEYASIGMALVTTEGRWSRVNRALCSLLGYSEAELLQKTFQDITHPDDLQSDLNYVHTLLTGESNAYQMEKRYFHKSGHVVWVLLSVSLVRDDRGMPQYFISQIQDITERKKAEDSLREEQEKAQNYLGTAGVMMLALDRDGTVTLVNQKGCEILGYSADEIIGKNWINTCLPETNRGELQSIFQLRISEQPEATEYFENLVLTKSGDQRLIAWHNTVIRDKDGNIVSTLSSGEDITERRKVETALVESNTRFRTLFEASPDAILLIDPNECWSIIDCNTAACQMNGYSREELIGQCIDILNTDPERPNERAEYMERIQQHGILHYETSHRRKDGAIIAVEVSTSIIDVGPRQLVLGIDRDITERKRAENELRFEKERFESIAAAVPGIIFSFRIRSDGSMCIPFATHAIQDVYGLLPTDVQHDATPLFGRVHLDDLPRLMTSIHESAQTMLLWHSEFRYQHPTKGEVWIEGQAVPLREANGSIIWHGSIYDITERKRAEEEIRRRAEETSALLETSLALTNLDLKATLQTIGNSANTLFLADGCRIFLMEPDGETLRCVLALQENTTAFSDLRIKIGEGVTGAVAASGLPEIVNEMQNDPRAVQVFGTDEEQEAIMFAPLKERGRTIGILSVRRVGEKRCFQQTDLDLLEAFASMAASAVSNARLFEETHHRLDDLHASEERFRQLADNIQEAFWMTDAENGREIYLSPAMETIWGRSVQIMMEPDSYINSIFPEDLHAVLDAIEKEKRGEKMQFEYRIIRPDGSLRWIWDRAFPIFDESGKVRRIAGISADITERKEAAEKLRESEDRYHSLFQNQLHGSALHEIVTNDQGQPIDYIFLKVNPAFEKMTGLEAQNLVGRRVTEVVPGIENERLIQIYGQVALTGEPAHLNEYFAPLERYYEINAYATGPRQFAVSFMDVTERRQAEQELRKLSRAVEQSSSTIVITDTSGNIEYVNPKFTQITGYSFEEVIGRNPRILKSGFTWEDEYAQLWQTITNGGEWHGEILNKKKDGQLFWESVTISPILNDRREITHFVGVKEDITERKQSEIETRRHIAELEAVYENGLSVGRLLEPSEIGNRLIETFSRYLPWHHVTIRLRKEDSDNLELVAFSLPSLKEEERADAEQYFVARINKVGQGLSGWVIQTGNPFRTGDVHAHPQYIDTHAGIQSGLYMPLKVGERVIGVISVESEAPNAFTEQDERLLATLANQTAVAFENARLYEAMQKELSERKRVEDALRVSETHYRALADSITDILFELDQDFRYTHWNKASEIFSGIPAENVIGKTMQDVFAASEAQSKREEIYRRVLKERRATTFETEVLANGQKRALEINAYPSARGVSVVAKDVTDRKRTEIIMQKRFELMEYSAKHSLKDLMQKTVDEVSELTGSTIGFFHFMEQDQIHLGMQAWSTNALRLFHVSAEDGAHLPLDQAGVWAEAVRQRRPLIQNDYESLAQKKGVPQGHVPILREMVIPIIRNECIMAVLGLGNKPQDYTSQDLAIAARLADYAWDVTDRKQMELALELERNQLVQRVDERTADLSRANSNLARALRVKDEFLANMSHELRTPLNAILGLSESLGEQIAGPLNEKQQKYISTIGESGHHLLSLINDILDLAKIDAGHITLDINKVDIRSVCNASLRMVKQLAQKKNQEVSLKIDEGLGLMWADERRLKQMIVNLLGNAVKFTPENGTLGLEVHGDEEANQIAITVWDNGIGIKQDDLARLFQPFVQLDSGLAREATGTGLGLALVAQMARLHGGGVNAVSEAGKGSRFTIVLPWEPALAIDTASRMKITGKFRAIQTHDTNKPSILLVEDTKEVVMMLKDYLELTGYNVFTAQDGIDGIVQARHVKPDLILMDVQMPRMDGFETTRKLRSDPNFRYTPIIALTALAMPHDRERCLEAGMDEYISKPVNLKALVKVIQSCLFEQESRTR